METMQQTRYRARVEDATDAIIKELLNKGFTLREIDEEIIPRILEVTNKDTGSINPYSVLNK